MRLASLAVLVSALSGCTIYFGDDDHGDDQCLGPPIQELRDPQTGQCSGFGGGCGPQPLALPDWASCGGRCDGLDQPTCEATSGCRAIFVDTCPACDALFLSYAACWGTAPSGPIEGGGCNGLDAQACSDHDDCAAVHANLEAPGGGSGSGFTNTVGPFEWCQPELSPTPFTCGNLTCATGQYCGITYPGVYGAPVQYVCADLPSTCTPGNACDCLRNAGVCATQCTFDSAGNLTASCFLP